MTSKPVDLTDDNLIDLIRNYWPAFVFDNKDYRECKIQFLLYFFEAFIADVNEQISYLMYEDCENNNTCLERLKKFDDRTLLFCRVRYFLKKINSIPFRLGDLYFKNSKTIKVHIRSAMHFLIYLNNKVDVFYNLTTRAISLVSEEEHLNKLLEEQIEKRAEIAEELGLLSIRLTEQEDEMNDLKKEHEDMLREKSNSAKLFEQQSLGIISMESETANLEYELKLLEEKETQLQSRIVSTEEFSTLLKTQTFLKEQLNDLSQNCFDSVDIKTISDEIRQIQVYNAKLKRLTLNLDKLELTDLLRITEQVTVAEAARKQNISQLEKCKNLHSSKVLKVKSLKDSLNKAESSDKNLREETLAEECFYKMKIHEMKEKYLVDSKKHDDHEKQKDLIRKMLSEFSEKEQALETTMTEQYSKVLVRYGECTMNFHDMLKKMDEVTKPHNSL